MAAALLVSSHRKAVSRHHDTALPAALGYQSFMADLCSFAARFPFVKFGMTHVCYGSMRSAIDVEGMPLVPHGLSCGRAVVSARFFMGIQRFLLPLTTRLWLRLRA